MRILVDYRPALRERTGVGEYVHEMVRAYTTLPEARDDRVTLFSSSWKDRLRIPSDESPNAAIVDRRFPVAMLNYAWHRLEWPPIETLAGPADVVHAQHPLLIPSRRAAQVITIHDLSFLSARERTRAEIRRDYAELAPDHARRADAVLTSSQYSAGLIARELKVPSERIYVCPAGAPRWKHLGVEPRLPRAGYILFIGTLEPRKNVGALLDAYAQLIGRDNRVPKLVLAGRSTPDAADWLDRIQRAPLASHVEHRGYVAAGDREALFAGARLLVMPSLDEGFGLPILEAMSAGVPVVASNRGSLPEVLGDAGPAVEPEPDALAAAMSRLLADDEAAKACAARGLERARQFSWPRTARVVRQMYLDAVTRRRAR